MTRAKKLELVYDDQCPVCQVYCTNIRLKDGEGELLLTDARKPGPAMELVTAKGLDIDEGMVLKIGDDIHYGSDAVAELSKYTDSSTASGILNKIFYRTPLLARIFYPPSKAVRNGLLRLLRIEKIRNLEQGHEK
jgi:predicted DCC family thiol-disulfide oxidoreductase YuxK